MGPSSAWADASVQIGSAKRCEVAVVIKTPPAPGGVDPESVATGVLVPVGFDAMLWPRRPSDLERTGQGEGCTLTAAEAQADGLQECEHKHKSCLTYDAYMLI